MLILLQKWARKDSPVLGFFPSKPSSKRLWAACSAIELQNHVCAIFLTNSTEYLLEIWEDFCSFVIVMIRWNWTFRDINGPGRIRTFNQAVMSRLLRHWATGPCMGYFTRGLWIGVAIIARHWERTGRLLRMQWILVDLPTWSLCSQFGKRWSPITQFIRFV